MTHLILENLTKRFGNLTAVQQLWLSINRGEILSLLGPSGCGKSTTLQMIAGILSPDAGQVILGDRPLNKVPPEKRDIALVLQRGLLFPHLTVGENVAFGLRMRGVNRVDREKEAIAMLHRVQLSGFEHRKPSELSGGQAQRVALARSLVIHPEVLLLDEPLSALDTNLREEMQDLILSLQAQTGVTLLVVTHDQAEAAILSHRVAVMLDGQLRQVDRPEQVYQYPSDETVARFMGGVNFFTVEAQEHQWQLCGQRLISAMPATGKICATVRPEHIQLFTHAPPMDVNILTGTILSLRFTVSHRRVTVAIAPDFYLHVWTLPTLDLYVGQSVWLHIPRQSLWGFPNPISPSSYPPKHSIDVFQPKLHSE